VPKAELVFANVVDVRSWEAEGQGATPLVYTISIPGRALPFVVVRYWKAPQGYVAERVELIAPSGKTAYRSEEHVRRMTGQMDLTPIADVVEDGVGDPADQVVADLDAVALGGLDDGFIGVTDHVPAVQLELDRHRRLLFLAHRRHVSAPARPISRSPWGSISPHSESG